MSSEWVRITLENGQKAHVNLARAILISEINDPDYAPAEGENGILKTNITFSDDFGISVQETIWEIRNRLWGGDDLDET